MGTMGGVQAKFSEAWKAICQRFSGLPEGRILMLGLDAAGKTTILYRLSFDEQVQTIPMIGFNVETINTGKIKSTVWDIGGQDKIRPLWKHYFADVDAIIFVVDSNDRERIENDADPMGTAKIELIKLLNESQLTDVKLLVLANKQDLPNALTPQEVSETLGLPDLKDRTWYIQGTCATTGEGLSEGLAWLEKQLKNK